MTGHSMPAPDERRTSAASPGDPGPPQTRPPGEPPRRLPEDWVGALTMGLLAAITFANVVARYFTDQSFAWTEELSVSLMVILTMVAAGAAVARDRHIRIEFLFASGSATRQHALALLSHAATVLAFLCIAGLGMRLAWDDFRFEVTSPGIGVPQWWYTIWLPLLALAIAARAMQRLVRTSRRR